MAAFIKSFTKNCRSLSPFDLILLFALAGAGSSPLMFLR
jgi:hypothetical protein